MKSIAAAAALLAGTVTATCVQDPVGNYYCEQVDAITYKNVGGQGSYDKITNMDSNSGQCSSNPFPFSGNLSPLDEQISFHFRGPLKLKSFNVYLPKLTNTRRSEHLHRHARGAHAHHARAPAPEAAVGDLVVVTMDGQVVSWINEWDGKASAAPAPAPAATTPAAVPAIASAVKAAGSAVKSAVAAAGTYASTYKGDGWPRVAEYDSASGVAKGLTFLNHLGGANGSGVFDYKFGNSLSYASANGKDGSPVPVTLADTVLDDDTEIVIMSDQDCTDATCGYSRAGTVAKQGWAGAQKAFLMEFLMPDSGQTSPNIYTPKNMPAIWALNAQIPRTIQYGPPACSCWTSGCGELDIHEVLYPGYDKGKSTLHGLKAGGDSDYLPRPFTNTMKLAVLMNANSFHIQVLDSNFNFTDGLSTAQINEITTTASTPGNNVSIFDLLHALIG